MLIVIGDFVRVNGLQEGDFIVIYSDTKCGKFVRNFLRFFPGLPLRYMYIVRFSFYFILIIV